MYTKSAVDLHFYMLNREQSIHFFQVKLGKIYTLGEKVNPSPLFAPKVKIETMQGHYLYGNTAAPLFVYKEIMQGHKQKS